MSRSHPNWIISVGDIELMRSDENGSIDTIFGPASESPPVQAETVERTVGDIHVDTNGSITMYQPEESPDAAEMDRFLTYSRSTLFNSLQAHTSSVWPSIWRQVMDPDAAEMDRFLTYSRSTLFNSLQAHTSSVWPSIWRQVMDPGLSPDLMRFTFDVHDPVVPPRTTIVSPQIYDELVELAREENRPIWTQTQNPAPTQEVYEMKDEPQKFITINQLFDVLQDSVKEDEQKKVLEDYKHFIEEAKTKILAAWDLFKVENPTAKNRHTQKFLSRLLYSRNTTFANAFAGKSFSTYQMDRVIYIDIRLNAPVNLTRLRINTRNWTCELTT